MPRYQKLPKTPDVANALGAQEQANIPVAAMLNTVLANEFVDNESLRLALLQSGATVRLDTGEQVWVACAIDDSPPHHLVKFLAVAIAEGVPPALYTLTVDHATVVERGVDTIRKEMMLTILGEDDSTPEQAQRSIRTRLKVAAQVAVAPKDVL